MSLVYLVPAVERPVGEDSDQKVWIPKYDPDGREMHDHDRIWYAETSPPQLIRVIRGTPPPPSWAREADVTFLGQFPDDPRAIRHWAARYFRGELKPEEVRAQSTTLAEQLLQR
ncbi:MAG TPA: hypothetical protein VMG99_08740 [Thermoplasmata archaeon]|nr:hypothetical protein [Thermoplasmata archaeon]